MTDEQSPKARMSPHGPEVYRQADNLAFEERLADRTASREAAFLLPHLRAGMQVLDVGCGPGSITIGLAEAVAPGQVVGIDIQPATVERARDLAAKRGVNNVRFETADIYALPFPDHTFDAVFANAALMHLREPMRALVELRRVLRPGGIVGVRDQDWGATIRTPMTPLLKQWRTISMRTRPHENNLMARDYRRLLLDAGFARTEAGASLECAGTPHETIRHAAFLKAQLQGVAKRALAEGWVDEATIEAIAAEFDVWARRPDAFFAVTWCEAVGWAGE